VFLDAADEALIRRFSETRRRHPLLSTDIRAALHAERAQLRPMLEEADGVIDTSGLTVQGLRDVIQDRFGRGGDRLAVTLLSFGFKLGLPPEADIVLDVRFVPNPFFVPHLSHLSGQDEPVRQFVLSQAEAQAFLAKAEDLLRLSIQGFEKEGKAHATIAIGCTGGQHRSVALVVELAARLGPDIPLSVRHRDLKRAGA
jgi:UPF0042 nucleotide-binding protein